MSDLNISFLRIHAWTWSRKKTRHPPNILLCIQNGSKRVSSSKFACKLSGIRGMADVYDGGGLLVMFYYTFTISDTFLNAFKISRNVNLFLERSFYSFRIHIFLPSFLSPSKPVKQWPKRVKPKPGVWTAIHLSDFAETTLLIRSFFFFQQAYRSCTYHRNVNCTSTKTQGWPSSTSANFRHPSHPAYTHPSQKTQCCPRSTAEHRYKSTSGFMYFILAVIYVQI